MNIISKISDKAMEEKIRKVNDKILINIEKRIVSLEQSIIRLNDDIKIMRNIYKGESI